MASGQATGSVLLIAVLLGGLVAYKGSAAVTSLRLAATTRSVPSAGRVALVLPGKSASLLDAISRTATYLVVVGPALLFGILISGAVGACVSPSWLARVLGRGSMRQQLLAGVTGAPLMLCSCCVTPVFSAVYERSRRAGPSLAVALASPSLNPAGLALTFMFFQPRIAAARLGMALVGVFAVAPLVARVAGKQRTARATLSSAGDAEPRCTVAGFMASCMHVAVRTVPVIVVGLVASMWLAEHLPVDLFLFTLFTARLFTAGLFTAGPYAAGPFAAGSGRLLAIAIASAVAVPLALPTFFEIPLALTFMSAGAPSGVAAALLFAGPAINLSSLVAIGRATSWKLATLTALAIGLLACVGGVLVG